jgi:hypothetical protein
MCSEWTLDLLVANWSALLVCVIDVALMAETIIDTKRVFLDQSCLIKRQLWPSPLLSYIKN